MKGKMNTKTIIIIIALLAVFAVIAPEFMAIGEDTSVNVKVVGMNDAPLRGVEIRTSADGIPIRISDPDGLIYNLDSFVYYLVTPSRSSGYGSSQVRFARGGEYTIKYTDVESTTVIRWGDIPPPDTGTGGDGDTGTIPNGDGTADSTTNVTGGDGFFDRHPASKEGFKTFALTAASIIGIFGVFSLVFGGTPLGLMMMAMLTGVVSLATGLYSGLKSWDIPGTIAEKFFKLPKEIFDTAGEEVIAIIDEVKDKVVDGASNVYNYLGDTISEIPANIIEGDIMGALMALITAIIVIVIFVSVIILSIMIVKVLVVKKVMDK